MIDRQRAVNPALPASSAPALIILRIAPLASWTLSRILPPPDPEPRRGSNFRRPGEAINTGRMSASHLLLAMSPNGTPSTKFSASSQVW